MTMPPPAATALPASCSFSSSSSWGCLRLGGMAHRWSAVGQGRRPRLGCARSKRRAAPEACLSPTVCPPAPDHGGACLPAGGEKRVGGAGAALSWPGWAFLPGWNCQHTVSGRDLTNGKGCRDGANSVLGDAERQVGPGAIMPAPRRQRERAHGAQSQLQAPCAAEGPLIVPSSSQPWTVHAMSQLAAPVDTQRCRGAVRRLASTASGGGAGPLTCRATHPAGSNAFSLASCLGMAESLPAATG